jgi:hypothetical protein
MFLFDRPRQGSGVIRIKIHLKFHRG